MTVHPAIQTLRPDALADAVDKAGRAIPPLWPLAATVAVNPYLGQTGETLAEAGARLARVAGAPVTMPRSWYAARIKGGRISDADLDAALAAAPAQLRPADLDALKAEAEGQAPAPKTVPTIADLAAQATGIDWPGLIAERFGHWAAGYLDEGQALWAAPRGKGAYAAWRDVATHDLTPELIGLTGFAAHVADAPETAPEAMARACATLGLKPEMLDTYFHSLLATLGGWAQMARYRLWQAELAGATDNTLAQFLAIRLVWEEALHNLVAEKIADRWADARATHAEPPAPSADDVVDMILQEAAERAAQRGIAETLAQPSPVVTDERPAVQAAFCIDVRSEVFRRAFEATDPGVRTMGFAGFFGVFAQHRGFGSDVAEHRMPVLLNSTVCSISGGEEDADADLKARLTARALRAWGRFKLAAVSSFAFVEAMGPVYAAKLIRDSLGMEEKGAPDDPAPRLDPVLSKDEKLGAAAMVLGAMSLREDYARVIVLTGHGANVTNNAHASALHCGACGGYAGDVNARLLAALMNDPDVRAGLPGKGFHIPDDTLFVAALHDTTTDRVTLYTGDVDTSAHTADLAQIQMWLDAAGRATRAERALRLPRANGDDAVFKRARDWAEVRPEWGLAGCKAFIAAPRGRTAGKSLEGRAFLHDYIWQKDEGFGVLELIMTAPVVVASWISLQYYGSTVSPDVFGGGNKLLHNVTGGIGVVEGNGGTLRAGLPWQSVHDGEAYQHDPLRLSVCIEAPVEAMTDILKRHDGVRALFDNRWLHLFAMDGEGHLAQRYVGDLAWEPVTAEAYAEPLKAAG